MSSSEKQSSLRKRRDVQVTATKNESIEGDSQRSSISQSLSNLSSFDLLMPLSLVFGGCCSCVFPAFLRCIALIIQLYRNVWSFEELLRSSSQLGLTFSPQYWTLNLYTRTRHADNVWPNAVYYLPFTAIIRSMAQSGTVGNAYAHSTSSSSW